jgi:glucose-6-phosphate 1-dehydrogenase
MKFESQMILIFGATGDLTRRKLIPSLYHLVAKKRLTRCTPIICVGRRKLSKEKFVELLSLEKFIPDHDSSVLADLKGRLEYLQYDQETGVNNSFSKAVDDLRQRHGCTSNMLIYLALPTSAFQHTAKLIGSLEMGDGWRRVVFEKPFGEDLASARILNNSIREVLEEDEIFRVDHYLGKELVQNILTLRFANEIFSGVWRESAIDHIQITVAETLGVEKRAGYYDKSGAVRDMIQNHLLQLLSFVAMEPPADNTPDSLRDSAVAVMRNLTTLQKDDIVLGQYDAGFSQSGSVPAYVDEDGIDDASTTETFAALRAFVDSKRWQNVPFYLRTGKRMSRRYADIKIVFRQRLNHLVASENEPNMVVIRIQPDEGIAMTINVRKPGEDGETESVLMDFCHHCHFGPNTPEAYESILYNVMEGDHRIFPRWDWIEASWEYIDNLRSIAGPPVLYGSGSEGPAEADALLEADGRTWLHVEPIQQLITPFRLR